MAGARGQERLSIVICGHVDTGKMTLRQRLMFELGGVHEREMEKVREEAAAMGKGPFLFEWTCSAK